MRAPDLDDVGIFFAELHKRLIQHVDCGQNMILHRNECRDVHRRRECVVGALRFIDVVVGVNQLFAQNLVGARRYHLVDVHVALRAAARLPDHQREFFIQLARQNLVARGGDCIGTLLIQIAQLAVSQCRRLFKDGERANHLTRNGLRADREILVAALSLCAPVVVRRHANLAHCIMLNAVFHRSASRLSGFRLCFVIASDMGDDLIADFAAQTDIALRRKNLLHLLAGHMRSDHSFHFIITLRYSLSSFL